MAPSLKKLVRAIVILFVSFLLSSDRVLGTEADSIKSLMTPIAATPTCGMCSPGTLRNINASCSTKAAARLFITSGSAAVNAKSTCEAFAQSVNSVQKIVTEWVEKTVIEPGNMCASSKIQDVISACGSAIAKGYTSSFVKVSIDGSATGCADASAKSQAFASAFAGICVDMWLGVTDGFSSAESELQVQALQNALSAVWTEASKSVCQVNSGLAIDFEESFAAKVTQAISCVFAEVAVKLCKQCSCVDTTGVEALYLKSESEANIHACSKTVTLQQVSGGNAGVIEKNSVLCDGKRAQCCDSYYHDKTSCMCGRSCQMAKTSNSLWEDSSSLCYCDTTGK